MKRVWVASAAIAVGAAVLAAFFWLAPKGSEPKKRAVRHRTVASAPVPEPEVVSLPSPVPAKPVEKATVETVPSETPAEPEENDSNLAVEAAEFCAMLDLSEKIASEIVRLLGERDLEAERILEVYGGQLTVDAIRTVYPRLKMLDDDTDRAIEALLTQEQQGRYRNLREQNIIGGTAIGVPPPFPPEDVPDDNSHED